MTLLEDVPVVRFTPERAQMLVEAGILEEGSFELLDGVIISRMAEGWDHARICRLLDRRFSGTYGDRWIGNSPLRLSEYTEVAPDVTLLREDATWKPAVATDVALVIEVSRSSLGYDLGAKHEAYAEAGVPEYAVIDVRRRVVLWHASPVAGVYTETRELTEDDDLAGFRIADLLPPLP